MTSMTAPQPGQDPLTWYVELRRHTGNEGDRLTPQGAADAEMIGRDGLHPPCAAFVSAGAARATQMPEMLRHAAGQDDTPITAATGLRSSVENRWRDAARAAGKRAALKDIRAIGPDLAGRETWLPGSALRQVVAGLPEDGRALMAARSAILGHRPGHAAHRAGAIHSSWSTGCSAAWLARVLWVHEVAGSSPASPTFRVISGTQASREGAGRSAGGCLQKN